MKKSLLALAFGGLGLGMTEFVIMGILPDVAHTLQISIPKAGHFISSYALGVGVGAPLLILSMRKQPPKYTLIGFMVLFIIGNTLSAFAGNYWIMLILRFISGLPHGAFFGVGSIVAEKVADDGKSSQAVATMFAGLTVANLIGVPLGTYIGNIFSWRYTFILVGLWGLITLFFLFRWLPPIPGDKNAALKKQFVFLKSPIPWILMIITTLGNGGLFAWYSYITPLMTHVSGFPGEAITWIMVVGGLGMFTGNYMSGKLSDKYTPQKTARFFLIALSISLLLVFGLSYDKIMSIVLTFTSTALAFALSTPMQILLINHAKGGEMLGAATGQVSFNIGNAVGAYCGGLPIEAGLSYAYPSLVGAVFAFIGFLFMIFYYYKEKHISTIESTPFTP